MYDRYYKEIHNKNSNTSCNADHNNVGNKMNINIIEIIDNIYNNNTRFLVFPLYGHNLYEYQKSIRFAPIPISICKNIAKDIINGVDFLHNRCQLIHRDLKLENIVFKNYSEVVSKNNCSIVIIDLGWAIFKDGAMSQDNEVEEDVIGADVTEEDVTNMDVTEEDVSEEDVNDSVKRREHYVGNKIFSIPTIFGKKNTVNVNKINVLSNNNGLSNNNILSNNKVFAMNKPQLLSQKYNVIQSNTEGYYLQSRYYRAPELIFRISKGCSIDIWSIGCILFEIIVGKPLFGVRKSVNNIKLFQKDNKGMWNT